MKFILALLLLGLPIYSYEIVPIVLTHKGFGENDLAQKLVNYAYDKGQDLDFVKTLNAENGGRNHLLQSKVVSNGRREQSFGLCQLGYRRHKNFIDTEEFKDPYKQISYCRGVWLDAKRKGWMPFMAYWYKDNRGGNIIFQKTDRVLFIVNNNENHGGH